MTRMHGQEEAWRGYYTAGDELPSFEEEEGEMNAELLADAHETDSLVSNEAEELVTRFLSKLEPPTTSLTSVVSITAIEDELQTVEDRPTEGDQDRLKEPPPEERYPWPKAPSPRQIAWEWNSTAQPQDPRLLVQNYGEVYDEESPSSSPWDDGVLSVPRGGKVNGPAAGDPCDTSSHDVLNNSSDGDCGSETRKPDDDGKPVTKADSSGTRCGDEKLQTDDQSGKERGMSPSPQSDRCFQLADDFSEQTGERGQETSRKSAVPSRSSKPKPESEVRIWNDTDSDHAKSESPSRADCTTPSDRSLQSSKSDRDRDRPYGQGHESLRNLSAMKGQSDVLMERRKRFRALALNVLKDAGRPVSRVNLLTSMERLGRPREWLGLSLKQLFSQGHMKGMVSFFTGGVGGQLLFKLDDTHSDEPEDDVRYYGLPKRQETKGAAKLFRGSKGAQITSLDRVARSSVGNLELRSQNQLEKEVSYGGFGKSRTSHESDPSVDQDVKYYGTTNAPRSKHHEREHRSLPRTIDRRRERPRESSRTSSDEDTLTTTFDGRIDRYRNDEKRACVKNAEGQRRPLVQGTSFDRRTPSSSGERSWSRHVQVRQIRHYSEESENLERGRDRATHSSSTHGRRSKSPRSKQSRNDEHSSDRRKSRPRTRAVTCMNKEYSKGGNSRRISPSRSIPKKRSRELENTRPGRRRVEPPHRGVAGLGCKNDAQGSTSHREERGNAKAQTARQKRSKTGRDKGVGSGRSMHPWSLRPSRAGEERFARDKEQVMDSLSSPGASVGRDDSGQNSDYPASSKLVAIENPPAEDAPSVASSGVESATTVEEGEIPAASFGKSKRSDSNRDGNARSRGAATSKIHSTGDKPVYKKRTLGSDHNGSSAVCRTVASFAKDNLERNGASTSYGGGSPAKPSGCTTDEALTSEDEKITTINRRRTVKKSRSSFSHTV